MNYVTGFKMCLYLNENKMNYLHVKKKRKREKKNRFSPIEAIYLYVKEHEI